MTPAAPVRMPTTPGEGNGVDAFFARCGLRPDARIHCLNSLVVQHPRNGTDTDTDEGEGAVGFREASPQGYCSYTLCHPDLRRVVQFRPVAHRIDPQVAAAAREVYGELAPELEVLEAHLEMPSSLWLLKQQQQSTSTKGNNNLPDDDNCVTAPIDEGVVLEDDDLHHDSSVEAGGGGGASFQVLSMTMIPGCSLTEVRTATAAATADPIQKQRESLVLQFADFIALGWKNRKTHRLSSTRTSCRHSSSSVVDVDVCGRVGSTMKWRLEQMRTHLPRRFRPEVERILDDGAFEAIWALPWVLTHGDIVPANIMVQRQRQQQQQQDSQSHNNEDRNTTITIPTAPLPTTSTITGFLDWAEAEYLPFGVGLYGLEEFLGESSTAHGDDGTTHRFEYYPEASRLRELFWLRLVTRSGTREEGDDGCQTPPTKEVVESAHVLGMLLWHGIAFDDGRLDRVVNEVRDQEEVQRLDAFFASVGGQSGGGGGGGCGGYTGV